MTVQCSREGCDPARLRYSCLDQVHRRMIELSVTKLQELLVRTAYATIEPMVTRDEKLAFAARLNELLDSRDFARKGAGRQTSLAAAMGVTQKGARKWLEGESLPTTARLMEIARKFNVEFEWLATGRTGENPTASLPESTESSPPRQRLVERIFSLVESLTPSQQQALLEQLELQHKENERMLAELSARRLRPVSAPKTPESKVLEHFPVAVTNEPPSRKSSKRK